MILRDRVSHLRHSRDQTSVWLLLATLFILTITFFSANKETGSDPKLTLVVSQALIEHGSIRLDPYQEQTIIDTPFQDMAAGTALINEKDGHYYAFFPAGPSVLSVPFVWLYQRLGKDMLTHDNFELQIILAALSTTLIFWLLYRTGTYLVGRRASLIISFFAVAGSSLSSTLGVALWTLNFSTLFITIILLLLVRDAEGKSFNPYLVGLLLFLCYFTRPSTAVFILPVLLYLFMQRRSRFWPTALTALALLLLFVGWSWLEFGQVLPDYYSLTRLQEERAPLWVGVLGNLISPSRGLFIYSPFFILILLGVIFFWRELWPQPLFRLCLLWIALHLLIIARAVIWWGGVSYGPRLLTDALPGLVLLLFLIWREARQELTAVQRNAAVALFLLLGAVAVAIHLNGLYRLSAGRWNFFASPVGVAADAPLGDFFAWRNPQILAGNEAVCVLEAERMAIYLNHDTTLVPYRLGQTITMNDDGFVPIALLHELALAARAEPTATPLPPAQPAPVGERAYLPAVITYGRYGNRAIFIGWDIPSADLVERRSICPRATVVVRLPDQPYNEETYQLHISARAIHEQPVTIAINGVAAGEARWSYEPETMSIEIPGKLLRPGELNEITFEFSQALPSPPELNFYRLQWDDRQFALVLRELALSAGPTLEAASPPDPYP